MSDMREEFIQDYIEGYEFRGDDGDYSPSSAERFLIADCVAGLIDELDKLQAGGTPAPQMSRIAQKKIEQMGGTPVGLLVQNEAGAYAALDEHGRCTRLDAGVMGPVAVAYDPEVCTHGDSDDDAACEECIEKWTLQAARAQGDAVPDEWRECLAEMVQAMHDYEMSVDEGAPYKHRAMMDRAHALLSSTPQPEGDGWIKCSKQDLAAILGNLQYAGFNLCREFDFSRIQRPGRRTTESTCPDDSLLIAIRDLSELIDEPLPQPPKEGEGDE